MTRPRRRDDWFADADIDKAHIFVPAIMGVGIVISLMTLARDALHARQWRGRARRVALQAHASARHVLTGESAELALRAGVRPRVSYVLTGLSSGGLAVYIGVGATANYLRPGGYVAGIAWLWTLSLVTTALFAAVAVACAAAVLTWPQPARWQLPLLASTPLGQQPPPAGSAPDSRSLLLGWAAAGTTAAAGVLAFVVARAPHRISGADEWFARTLQDRNVADVLDRLDPVGPTPTYLVLAAVIGLAGLRCPPLTLTYLGCVVLGLASDAGLGELIPRDRPPSGPQAGAADSFPGGHAIQAGLVVVFVPLAITVLSRRRWLPVAAVAVLVVGLVAAAAGSLHDGVHWWSDLVGGALFGGALALTGWWGLVHRRWHRQCRQCPWSAPARRGGHEVIALTPRAERLIRRATRTWVPAAVLGLVVLALFVGLPANPEGDPFTSQVQTAAQLALLAVVAVGWLVGWWWEATAAVLIAVAGSTLGILAALAYHPAVSLVVTLAFLAPAVGFWLGWHQRRSVRAVAALGMCTALLLGGTWAGAAVVHDRYYGPAHPASPQRALPVDRVVWSWAGGVTARSATVVAELVPGARQARLLIEPEGSGTVGTSAVVTAGQDRVVRLVVDGLAAGTAHRYRIEVDGVADRSRGVGSLRTMPDGAASFTVAFGACARTGSSGAVFDAIAALRPLLYVESGDLHYGNPSTNAVSVFGNLYRRTLTAPAQAALYRTVPVAYVWDDHDYGPNDADAASPTRVAARAAYDRFVPHYPLPDARPGGGAIYQAFTVGRVRFVLTDTRSERTAESMLGRRQLAWLERELTTASRTHALVVWVNPDPWVTPADPTSDDWGGYPAEREHLAEVIADAGIDDLVMVAGDAHMVAIDDGTGTDFSGTGHGGFPLLHAAALDRPGGVKGGPYSEGAFPGAGQFGTVTVTDDGGSSVTVELAGRNWRGEVLVEHHVTVVVQQP